MYIKSHQCAKLVTFREFEERFTGQWVAMLERRVDLSGDRYKHECYVVETGDD